jgi:16S rRNA G1207 methylase RsmC
VSAATTRFECPQGRFQLKRYPHRTRETLQAWCAADSLLLEEAVQHADSGAGTLVVNDEQGALCTALQPRTLWTDSWLAADAANRNLRDNRREPVQVLWSTQSPPFADLVLMRIPKSLPYFEYQLASLALVLPEGTLLLAAGMDKHLSPHTAATLERLFGPCHRYPGRHKARLFAATRQAGSAQVLPPPVEYRIPTLPLPLMAHSNVFSHDRLDHGTRLLLSVLGEQSPASRAVDLACGNGVVGLHLLHWAMAESVLFCDESAMAVDSVKMNLPEQWRAQAEVHHGDGLQGSSSSADLVVLNPPFHLGHVVDEYAGRRLIQQAHDTLVPGGRLILVFNNHLKYRSLLHRKFDQTVELARDNKFSVVLATRA